MANLGTLWFGADIDLTALKQKIQNGNQSILDALKMNYDPQSYQQMVSKLRTELGKETFDIKINTNAAAVRQSLQNSLSSINNSANAPKLDLSGLKGISGMKMQMAQLTESIVLQTEKVRTLKREWQNMVSAHGKESAQAKAAFSSYRSAVDSLNMLRTNAGLLGVDMRRASIAAQENARNMRDAAKSARQWNSDHMRLNATLAGGIHISTQLGSALSSLFAIDAARQFLGQVIEIGGQLEKQRISIGAILGDTVKAGHLFEQIKGLALQSPFGVVELDQYTKQLSAYGFKYNELFDMTKRLADISAGAGTDIGRLTLALGHVRSATYLTGITLRQFSMNNIPMLKMLADYYSEVEKHAVTTAEVQKRISKRQVSYEDVIEQIRRLTDEGGMFYNMQEKISESLAARYKNLRDAMDIMYGEMAEGMVGDALKDLAGVLLKTTRHWREIMNVMGVAMGVFMLSKLRIGALTVAMQGNTAATLKNIMANKQLAANQLMAASTYRTLTAQERIAVASRNSLTAADLRQAMAVKSLTKSDVLRLVALKKINVAQAMHLAGVNGITAAEIRAAAAAGRWRAALAGLQMSLKNAFMGVGAGTWATLGLMAVTGLVSAYDQWKDRIDEKSKEMKDLIKSRIIDMQKLQKTIKDEGKPTDNVELKNRVDEMKQVLANSEAYTKTLDEQLKKTNGLPEQYDILATAIENAVEKNRRMLDVQDDVAEMIKASTGDLGSWHINENMEWMFNDDINKNMQQTLDAYKNLRTVIDTAWEYKDAIKNVIDEMVKAGTISEGFAAQLSKAPFEEQIRLLAESGYWQAIVDKISSTDLGFLQFADRIKEASNGVTKRWDEIANDDIPRMMKKVMQERNMDEKELNKWAMNNVDDFKVMLEGIADQLGVQEPEIRRRLKRLFYDYVRFGELEKGLADGAAIGASLFDDETLKKLLDKDEKADITDKNDNTTKKEGKRDKELEAAKTKLQQYKAFLSEYKKYRELYDKEKAISKLGDLFPDLKDEKGNFLGLQLVDNYTEVLDKLRKSLPATTEARKKFHNEIDKTSADTVFDREKEAIKKSADAMDEYIKRMQEQWKLYRTLMSKSGGSRDFAALAFNDNGVMWDDVAKRLLERFNQRGEELGVVPIGFRWDMNEQELKDTLVDANGQVQTELVKLAQKIQEIIRGNYNKFLEESAEAYAKSLTKAQKVQELERQLADKERERNNYNGNDTTVIRGYEIQIRQLRKDLSQAKAELKEQEADVLQFYGAIFSMTIEKAESVGETLRENLVEQLKSGAISGEQYVRAIKKIDGQIDKLKDQKDFLEAFKSGGILGVKKLKLDIADDKLTNASNRLREAEDKLREAIDKNTQAKTPEDKEQTGEEVKIAKQKRDDAEGDFNVAKTNQATANKNFRNVKSFQSAVSGMALAIQWMVGALSEARQAASAFGEDLDANMSSFGQYYISFLEGLNSAIGKMQQGDMGGALSSLVFGSITGIAQKHDATLKQDQEASQRIAKDFQNSISMLEKKLESLLGGIDELRITQEDTAKLYRYIGVKDPELMKRMWSGNASDEDFGKFFMDSFVRGFKGSLKDFEVKTDTDKAVVDAIESGNYFDMAKANMLIQRDQLIRQLRDEEEMKNKDESKILDLKEQVAEMEEDIKNFAKDMAETLYGIDFKSWASELGEALVNAWAAGESGAEAYKKKVSEILQGLGVKMITERFVSKAIEPVMDEFLKQYEKDDGILTKEGMAILGRMYEAGETLQGQVNTFMDGLNTISEQYGADMKGSSSSSSVASGIKGMTEQTADLLASYINAIRADVSVIRISQAVHLPAIAASLQRTSVLAETQVTLQQQIAANTLRNADAADRIYDLLHKVSPDGTKFRVA